MQAVVEKASWQWHWNGAFLHYLYVELFSSLAFALFGGCGAKKKDFVTDAPVRPQVIIDTARGSGQVGILAQMFS